jgi:hypothetical protein
MAEPEPILTETQQYKDFEICVYLWLTPTGKYAAAGKWGRHGTTFGFDTSQEFTTIEAAKQCGFEVGKVRIDKHLVTP